MFKGGHPRFNEHLGTFAVIFPANRGHSGDEKMRDLCQQGSSNYMYSRSSTKINNDILCERCFQFSASNSVNTRRIAANLDINGKLIKFSK